MIDTRLAFMETAISAMLKDKFLGKTNTEANRELVIRHTKTQLYRFLKAQGRHSISIRLSEDGQTLKWKAKQRTRITFDITVQEGI